MMRILALSLLIASSGACFPDNGADSRVGRGRFVGLLKLIGDPPNSVKGAASPDGLLTVVDSETVLGIDDEDGRDPRLIGEEATRSLLAISSRPHGQVRWARSLGVLSGTAVEFSTAFLGTRPLILLSAGTIDIEGTTFDAPLFIELSEVDGGIVATESADLTVLDGEPAWSDLVATEDSLTLVGFASDGGASPERALIQRRAADLVTVELEADRSATEGASYERVAIDDEGAAYVAGRFRGEFALERTYAATEDRYFTAKLGPSAADPLWSRALGAATSEALPVAATAEGKLVLAGPLSPSDGTDDVLVGGQALILDGTDGAVEADPSLGGERTETIEITSVAAGKTDDGYILAGGFKGELSAGGDSSASGTEAAMYIYKGRNDGGGTVWLRAASSKSEVRPAFSAIADDGTFYAAGFFTELVDVSEEGETEQLEEEPRWFVLTVSP